MAFLEDPRLRQRWSRISHNAEAVTENAAAGIWTFQHDYITPCLASVSQSIDSCFSLCLGDREDRVRRRRDRQRGGGGAEYSFDFYDDWDDDDDALADTLGRGGSGTAATGGRSLLGSWGNTRGEDWDRLLAGKGNSRRGSTAVPDQPRRKRGMSYGTSSGGRRKTNEMDDPTIIPSTNSLGFLGRLPFKIGGPLRYKPSAANLRDQPITPFQGGRDEDVPLLGTQGDDGDDEVDFKVPTTRRERSGTTGSGDTSDSFRSRGDLFPSDGEGDEDAVPLDDEFDVALDRVDDRSSNKTRWSKGKRRADSKSIMSRSVSRTTIASQHSGSSVRFWQSSEGVIPVIEDDTEHTQLSLTDLQREEEEAEYEENEEIGRRRRAAAQLALERGLPTDPVVERLEKVKYGTPVVSQGQRLPQPSIAEHAVIIEEVPPDVSDYHQPRKAPANDDGNDGDKSFIPARLPNFR